MAYRGIEGVDIEVARRINRGISRAMDRVGHIVITRLKERSSGKLTRAWLRRADHPYATRHFSSLYDPSIINYDPQSPSPHIRELWHYEKSPSGLGVHTLNITNSSEIYNRFLFDGTFFMVHRGGIEDEVKRQLEEDNVPDDILEQEIMRELNR